jgi:hypothetical protein
MPKVIPALMIPITLYLLPGAGLLKMATLRVLFDEMAAL